MNCERCAQVNVVGSDIRGLAREIGRLQAQLAPVIAEYQRLRRVHPRCAACGVLIGPAHIEQSLVPEPIRPRARGQKRYDVCADCYQRLHTARRSVPQQRAYEKAQEAELLGEGPDEGEE